MKIDVLIPGLKSAKNIHLLTNVALIHDVKHSDSKTLEKEPTLNCAGGGDMMGIKNPLAEDRRASHNECKSDPGHTSPAII